MQNENNVQNLIDKAFKDQITNLLLKKSTLTQIQFETLIIDLLTDSISDEKVSFSQKANFRNKKVKRATFSRTLSQARKRISSSIFTIILLSYIGVFEEKPFESYLILAEKLKDYYQLLEKSEFKLSKSNLKKIEEELFENINSLSKPTNLKIV